METTVTTFGYIDRGLVEMPALISDATTTTLQPALEQLPHTGAGLELALLGVALVAGGVTLRRSRERRTPPATAPR